MMRTYRDIIRKKAREIDWKIFLFLLLTMNVKLVVKLAAILVFICIERKSFSVKSFIKQPHLLFYLLMVIIAVANFFLLHARFTKPYLLVMALGSMGWLMPALAGYLVITMVNRGDIEKIHRTIGFFFLLHIAMIFLSLVSIMMEIGTINPYTFKGLNQKYYISTGDYIRGITFDDAVTTAMIAGFGVLYFLYRRRFFYALLSMAAVLVIFSNLTNIFLVLVLGFVFIFRSDRVQKSMIIVFGCMMVIFISTVSPQNNEYVVSFLYKMIGKAYYLPPVKVITNDELKHMPDSLLTTTQRKEKTGLLYLDSISNLLQTRQTSVSDNPLAKADTTVKNSKTLNEYRPTAQVLDKENRFAAFLASHYTLSKKDSLIHQYNWERPGKLTAALQLRDLFKQHPSVKWLGAGTGNFSSRIAFKAAALGIGGSYPAQWRYLDPLFVDGHLFVYLYYHAQWQINHTAANTPDSTYYQLAGEYGLVGFCLFLLLYAGAFLTRMRGLRYAFPALLFLLMGLSIGYWFEQLSIVVLFEFLFFLDFATRPGEGRRR